MGETHLMEHRQTSKLGLIRVIHDLFPQDMLKTDYSIHEGIYCELVHSALSIREVDAIDKALRNWIEADQPIKFLEKRNGYYMYEVDGLLVKTIYPANEQPSRIDPFVIIPYSSGFIIDFGDVTANHKNYLIPPDKLMETYIKTQKWLKNIRLELIDHVNEYIESQRSQELMCMAEALQEKEISDIADLIFQQQRAIRVLLISGPSSSGKTTFAQRISTQLRVLGVKPVPLSLDDYFVERQETPLDEHGNYDFESLQAMDLELLREHVKGLIRGDVVETPVFDFVTGSRKKETRRLQVGPSEVLVMEGIHALNPNLLPKLNRNLFFKIYVSSLFSLNVDMANRVPTTEVRLLRRLVRGELFRGNTPEETLDQWPNVRKGEYENVFRYQEESDVMFNSSLVYELNALRPYAEASLNKIPDDSVHASTRDRLLNLLSFAKPIPTEKIAFNSILREFIGGSIY
ncbi:nucleoside kinase [Alkalibacter rhizosphaerae]|uniref:Nucleoside kinase n=1 Tax=Alkalibacter rhizosphaerae TaxID=2815577 RepID=A0A974XEB1_9FIRM|nr:nucleoside kinase [Alkalibacter rhizosphaerae]QSX08106.1 nucleoside kinase [Alkalibacter rhizosphaerae]